MDIKRFKKDSIDAGVTSRIKWLGQCISWECDLLSSFINDGKECEKHLKKIDELLLDIKQLVDYRNGGYCDDLREAAQCVVDRWDSPLWGGSEENIQHTGQCISALRDALKPPAGSP